MKGFISTFRCIVTIINNNSFRFGVPADYIFGNGLYIACAYNRIPQVLVSNDGVTWTPRTVMGGPPMGGLTRLAFFLGKFHATVFPFANGYQQRRYPHGHS